MVSVFSDALASSGIPVLDAAARYVELGEALLPLINPVTGAKYGIEITSFVVENISVPQEVESAIDQRSSMSAIGNLNDYVKFRLAQGLEKGGGGAGGTATELAVGLAVAQQIMQQQGGLTGTQPAASAVPAVRTGSTALSELLSPGEVAQLLGVSEGDVLQVIESGELKAKKIGSTYRIKRSALEAYLAD
jgi:excisionase family DNA binding protein